jgi:hypothetical protein
MLLIRGILRSGNTKLFKELEDPLSPLARNSKNTVIPLAKRFRAIAARMISAFKRR